MPWVECRKCGDRRRVTLFDSDAQCQECGASGEHLTPVPESDIDADAESDPESKPESDVESVESELESE